MARKRAAAKKTTTRKAAPRKAAGKAVRKAAPKKAAPKKAKRAASRPSELFAPVKGAERREIGHVLLEVGKAGGARCSMTQPSGYSM
jgi:hypothetical protein